MSSLGSTSSTLLEEVKARDQEAWQRFVLLYSPLLLFWLRRAGLTEADRADVSQEVFATVLRRIDEFDHSVPGASFRGWLRAITTNKIREHGRQAGKFTGERGVDSKDPSPESTATHSPNERHLVIHQALLIAEAEFTPKTWQAFRRTVLEDAPSNDVAEELQMTQNAVRLAKFRVLQRLQRLLAGFDGPVSDQLF